MKILITGNMGYVGPWVVKRLRSSCPDATLAGFDMGFFGACLTNDNVLPECGVDVQYFGDMRRPPKGLLDGVDGIVHLAAISNDPMGNAFESLTDEINYRASVDLAKRAKDEGVRRFVFASSCSVYGVAGDSPRDEGSEVNPLTAYARSKVFTESALEGLADDGFVATSLRFATACGMSARLRLDLVLNDFVAAALTDRKITILSDGTPWRPLINVKDMARAIDWALHRDGRDGQYLAVNIGSNQWNYQMHELAEAVAGAIPGVTISINRNAQPDKRSYRVCFDRFRSLAPAYQPEADLVTTIGELARGLEAMGFSDRNFRESHLMRLKMLQRLRAAGHVNEELIWDVRQHAAQPVEPSSAD